MKGSHSSKVLMPLAVNADLYKGNEDKQSVDKLKLPLGLEVDSKSPLTDRKSSARTFTTANQGDDVISSGDNNNSIRVAIRVRPMSERD